MTRRSAHYFAGAPRPHVPYWHDRTEALRRRSRARVRHHGAVTLLIAFFAIKSALIAAAGPIDYDRRLALLTEGTILDRVATWALQRDPVSQAGANILNGLMR